jgi:hypothetical protein
MTERRHRSVSRAPRNQDRHQPPSAREILLVPNLEFQLISAFFKAIQGYSSLFKEKK